MLTAAITLTLTVVAWKLVTFAIELRGALGDMFAPENQWGEDGR